MIRIALEQKGYQWPGVCTEQIGSQIGKRGLMHGIARDELSWNSPTARGRCLTSSHVLEKASLGSLKTGAISPACGRTRASKLAASAVLGAALVSRALPVAGLCDRERHARQGRRIRAGPVPPDEKRSRLKILGAFLPVSRDDLRKAVCAEASVYPLVVRHKNVLVSG